MEKPNLLYKHQERTCKTLFHVDAHRVHPIGGSQGCFIFRYDAMTSQRKKAKKSRDRSPDFHITSRSTRRVRMICRKAEPVRVSQLRSSQHRTKRYMQHLWW